MNTEEEKEGRTRPTASERKRRENIQNVYVKHKKGKKSIETEGVGKMDEVAPIDESRDKIESIENMGLDAGGATDDVIKDEVVADEVVEVTGPCEDSSDQSDIEDSDESVDSEDSDKRIKREEKSKMREDRSKSSSADLEGGNGEKEGAFESSSESMENEDEIVYTVSKKGKEKVAGKSKAVIRSRKGRKLSKLTARTGVGFPGGPENLDILKSFDTHVARYIWDGQEREPLKIIQHIPKIAHWDWSKECKKFKKRVNHTSLPPLKHVSYSRNNRVLVSAFIERWHPETNTFHLPFGEMTITLDDVRQITGLPVFGRAVTAPELKRDDAVNMLHTHLGVSHDDGLYELKFNKCNYVRLEWVRNLFAGKATDRDSVDIIDRHVQAFLLYLLGCSLFADKTGSKVPVTYLHFLANIGEIQNYSWGSAGLAYLYRQMGVASRFQVKQLAGYITLLEAWIYEHFPVDRSAPDLDFNDKYPRA